MWHSIKHSRGRFSSKSQYERSPASRVRRAQTCETRATSRGSRGRTTRGSRCRRTCRRGCRPSPPSTPMPTPRLVSTAQQQHNSFAEIVSTPMPTPASCLAASLLSLHPASCLASLLFVSGALVWHPAWGGVSLCRPTEAPPAKGKRLPLSVWA